MVPGRQSMSTNWDACALTFMSIIIIHHFAGGVRFTDSIQGAKSMKPIELQASYHHGLPGLLRHK